MTRCPPHRPVLALLLPQPFPQLLQKSLCVFPLHVGLIAHRVHPPARATLPAGGHAVSRFSRMEFLRMPGVFDSAGPRRTRAGVRRVVAFLALRRRRLPAPVDFGAQYPAYRYPCPTLQVQPYDCPRMARGQGGSLLLPCTTLSFATPCRFYPGAIQSETLRHVGAASLFLRGS